MSSKQKLCVKTAKNVKTYPILCKLDVANYVRAQFSSSRLFGRHGKFQQNRKAYREGRKAESIF